MKTFHKLCDDSVSLAFQCPYEPMWFWRVVVEKMWLKYHWVPRTWNVEIFAPFSEVWTSDLSRATRRNSLAAPSHSGDHRFKPHCQEWKFLHSSTYSILFQISLLYENYDWLKSLYLTRCWDIICVLISVWTQNIISRRFRSLRWLLKMFRQNPWSVLFS